MVAGKVKMVMGLQKSPANSKQTTHNSSPKPPSSSPSPSPNQEPKTGNNKQPSQKSSRSFGGYFPRSSSQVQPRPPDVPELLRLVEELREKESRLRTELVEQKLLRESVAIVPVLENQILSKDFEIEWFKKKIDCLEAENGHLRKEMETLHLEISKQKRKVGDFEAEIEDLKKANEELVLSSSQNVCPKTSIKPMRKCFSQIYYSREDNVILKSENEVKREQIGEMFADQKPRLSSCSTEEIMQSLRSRAPHVPKPPPRPSSSSSSSSERALAEISNIPAPPPPPPKLCQTVVPPPSRAAPPPPPPPPAKGLKGLPTKVRRVPEVVEFYHSLMRRDTRRESGCGAAAEGTAPATAAKDMIGEIENRSAYLTAVSSLFVFFSQSINF